MSKKITPMMTVTILAIIIVLGISYVPTSIGSRPDNVNVKQLPMFLGQWYQSDDPEYLSSMWILGGSMMGIVTNTLQGDMENASRSFELFSMSYNDSAKMVPEWRGYYNTQALNDLSAAVGSENPEAIMQAISEIGNKTCSTCHKDQKPYVWAEYRMNDFRDVLINTPEGPMPFPAGKMKYLVVGFDGTIVNALVGQKEDTGESFGLFRMMFDNMKEACRECHDEPPRYYVSEDVTDLINDTEPQIAAGNFGTVITNMEQIGEGCYKCHVVHESMQRIKEQMEKDED